MKIPALLAFLATASPVFAADQVKLPDPVTITVSRQTLQTIGQGLAELPLKTAAPIMNDLQTQLVAIDKAAQEAAEPKPEAAPPSAPEPAKPRK